VIGGDARPPDGRRPPAAAEPDAAAVPGAAVSTVGGSGSRLAASPLAKRIARDRGIDLASVRGTGPRGRILRADVEALPAASPAPPAPPPVGARGDTQRIVASRVQALIAQRMALAKRTIPDFAITMSVDMGPSDALRRGLAEHAAKADARTPSINDMIVKACALALREHPHANASYVDGEFHLHERVNVGVAVAAEGSLVVPTVFDADQRSLTSITAEVRRLVAAVREGRASAEELSAGTFTISNLGMFGVRDFVAVVNPPQAAILAVGGVEELPVVHDGQVVIGKRMAITLSCDHRVLYGATAAAFLARIRELLQDPLGLLL